MSLPALKDFSSETECKQYYIENYCHADIKTFDGIVVKFYEETFEHAFYTRTKKSWRAPKDHFSTERGERIDWIRAVLEDPSIIPRKGYDKARRTYDNSRRVTFLSPNNYVVVIFINNIGEGKFVTAYVVDNEDTAQKLSSSPLWEQTKRHKKTTGYLAQ